MASPHNQTGRNPGLMGGNINPSIVRRFCYYPEWINLRTSHSAKTLAILIMIIWVGSCSRPPSHYTKETFVMGTHASVIIYGRADSAAERISSAALGEMHRIEGIMSNWKGNSEISMLNRHSGRGPIRVSGEMVYLLQRAGYFSSLTGGAFDVTARPLVTLWGFQGGDPHLPSGDEIEGALRRVGTGRINIDTPAGTVELKQGTEIDLAGIAKGYAVDRCMSIIKSYGVEDALVNLGGNIKALGAPPGKEGWSVGIRDPRGSHRMAGSMVIRNQAVATSGNYENFVRIEGRRYGHIIDPRTGYPASDVLSVTVLTETALAADALSTGLFVLGPDESRRIRGAGKHKWKALFATAGNGETSFECLGEFGDRLELFNR